MEKKAKKKKFEVQENESLSDCLTRMDEEGYMPVRRRRSLSLKRRKVPKNQSYAVGKLFLMES